MVESRVLFPVVSVEYSEENETFVNFFLHFELLSLESAVNAATAIFRSFTHEASKMKWNLAVADRSASHRQCLNFCDHVDWMFSYALRDSTRGWRYVVVVTLSTISRVYRRTPDVQHMYENIFYDPQQRRGVSRDQDSSVASFDHDNITIESRTTDKKLNFIFQMHYN